MTNKKSFNLNTVIKTMGIISCIIINAGCAESLLLAALSPKKEDKKQVIVKSPKENFVTKEVYLTGKQFCKTYEDITKKENGKYISVQKYYDGGERTGIYAWTNKPFNSNWPSVLIFDGGPGQTLHDFEDPEAASEVNFIHMDQRGLGCSAPDSYDTYLDGRFYNSAFIIQDADEVRKAFGLEKWSVYGVSYGTVLATMYANKFPQKTLSALQEGIYFDGLNTHSSDWKKEKMNLVLSKLSLIRKKSFSKILKNQKYAKYVSSIFVKIWANEYAGNVLNNFINKMIAEDGTINENFLNSKTNSNNNSGEKYQLPQNPDAIDLQFHVSIKCNELSDWLLDTKDLVFNHSSLEFEVTDADIKWDDVCTQFNTKLNQNYSYNASNFPVYVPIYYFQGTHDGATLARGALKHWQTVPQGPVTMMLNQKGGHNPFINDLLSYTRLQNSDNSILESDKKNLEGIAKNIKNIFLNAVSAKPITIDLVATLNQYEPYGEYWLLYGKAPSDISQIQKELQGVSMHPLDPINQ